MGFQLQSITNSSPRCLTTVTSPSSTQSTTSPTSITFSAPISQNSKLPVLFSVVQTRQATPSSPSPSSIHTTQSPLPSKAQSITSPCSVSNCKTRSCEPIAQPNLQLTNSHGNHKPRPMPPLPLFSTKSPCSSTEASPPHHPSNPPRSSLHRCPQFQSTISKASATLKFYLSAGITTPCFSLHPHRRCCLPSKTKPLRRCSLSPLPSPQGRTTFLHPFAKKKKQIRKERRDSWAGLLEERREEPRK